MTTTSYGTWHKYNEGELTLRQGIEAALSFNPDGWDLDAIESEFRTAINAKLADAGITLNGDEFFGPTEECQGCREAAPGYIAEALEQVNAMFWTIVKKHEKR